MKNYKPLGEWSAPSYSSTGKPASAFEPKGRIEGMNTAGRSQVDAARGAGVNGAPGTAALSKSGSADPGRRKWSER